MGIGVGIAVGIGVGIGVSLGIAADSGRLGVEMSVPCDSLKHKPSALC